MTEELKQIKKIYGEDMMHLCRDLFPTILEKEGVLLDILTKNIAPTHSLASDITNRYLEDEFKSFIYSFTRAERREQVETNKTPFELLREAGYNLYECETEDDIQSFKHYYAHDEVICTIYRGGRLDRCHVFFAVKDNAKELKREDFKNPNREDEYGTSVISIQFTRGDVNTLSIKNRYNHTVNNPDSTFSNNLENIVPGLTKSFEKHFGFHIEGDKDETTDFLTDELHYTQARDGKYYRYNVEIDGVYYCENNIIVKDGKVIDEYAKNKERYLLIENYLVDLKEKTIVSFTNYDLSRKQLLSDAFTKSITDVCTEMKDITVTKEGNKRVISFKSKDDKVVKVKINSNNEIVGYENNYVKELESCFLINNRRLSELKVDSVKTIASGSLWRNVAMKELVLPNVEVIEDGFMQVNNCLERFEAPNLKFLGNKALASNNKLKVFSFPSLEEIGKNVLENNGSVEIVDLPRLKKLGDYFMCCHGGGLKKLNIRHVRRIGHCVLASINYVDEPLELMDVEEIGIKFLEQETYMPEIYMPKVKRIENSFMVSTQNLEYFYAPELEYIGDYSLFNNPCMISEIRGCLKNKQPCEVHVNLKYKR